MFKIVLDGFSGILDIQTFSGVGVCMCVWGGGGGGGGGVADHWIPIDKSMHTVCPQVLKINAHYHHLPPPHQTPHPHTTWTKNDIC